MIALLAWAKSTKNQNKTQTFVVKKKKREEVLKQSVDTDDSNFEVIIQEKVSEKTEENGVTHIKTSNRTFEVEQKKQTFEVRIFT